MKRVGILAGREITFPESIINSINEKGNGNVTAEMATFGGIRLDDFCITLEGLPGGRGRPRS